MSFGPPVLGGSFYFPGIFGLGLSRAERFVSLWIMGGGTGRTYVLAGPRGRFLVFGSAAWAGVWLAPFVDEVAVAGFVPAVELDAGDFAAADEVCEVCEGFFVGWEFFSDFGAVVFESSD